MTLAAYTCAIWSLLILRVTVGGMSAVRPMSVIMCSRTSSTASRVCTPSMSGLSVTESTSM